MFRENEFGDGKELKAFFNKELRDILKGSLSDDCRIAELKVWNTGTRKGVTASYDGRATIRFGDRRYMEILFGFYPNFDKPGYYLYTIEFNAGTSAGGVSTTTQLRGIEDLSTTIPDSIRAGMKKLSGIMIKAVNARVSRGEMSLEAGEKIQREAMEFMLLPAKRG